MPQSRHRIVLTVSLQPSDQTLLQQVRSRLSRYAAHLNISEVIRVALAIAESAPPEMVSRAMSQTTRVKAGRPMIRGWDQSDPAFEAEVAEQRQRLALLAEMQRLAAQTTRTPAQELRLQEIYQAFNLIPVPKEE